MKAALNRFVFLSFFASSSFVFGAPDMGASNELNVGQEAISGSSIEVELVPTEIDPRQLIAGEKPAKTKLIREILHMVHESLENEDPNAKGLTGLISNWVGKFNFRRIGINAHRYYYHQGRHGVLKNFVPDIMTMLLASHTIESTSSLWGTSLGAAARLPESVLWGIGVLGGVISVPGLDPLCIGLMFAYGVSERTRTIVHTGRVVLMKAASKSLQWTGMKYVMERFFENQNRAEALFEYLIAKPGDGDRAFRVQAEQKKPGSFEFDFIERKSGRLALRLQFEPDSGQASYLKSMTANPECLDCLREVVRSTELRSLGWNVRDVVRSGIAQSSAGSETLTPKFYVKERHEGTTEFHPGSIFVSPQWIRKGQSQKRCSTLGSQLENLSRFRERAS